jgi:hypothetical protein
MKLSRLFKHVFVTKKPKSYSAPPVAMATCQLNSARRISRVLPQFETSGIVHQESFYVAASVYTRKGPDGSTGVLTACRCVANVQIRRFPSSDGMSTVQGIRADPFSESATIRSELPSHAFKVPDLLSKRRRQQTVCAPIRPGPPKVRSAPGRFRVFEPGANEPSPPEFAASPARTRQRNATCTPSVCLRSPPAAGMPHSKTTIFDPGFLHGPWFPRGTRPQNFWGPITVSDDAFRP